MTRMACVVAALLIASSAAAQTPPAKLADVTMSAGAARRAPVLGPQPAIVPPVRPNPVGPATPPAAQQGR
jgi:hypothetical protein